MRSSPFRFSLVLGVLGTVFVSGCNQTPRRCSTCSRVDSPLPGRVVAVSSAPAAIPSVQTTVLVRRPIVATPSVPPTPQPRELALVPPVEKTDRSLAPELTAPQWRGVPAQTVVEKTTANTDVTMAGYSHAIDFSYVSGVLEHGRQPKIWLLRYAPAEVEDRFGGSVTLVLDEDEARHLSVGQSVRIEGALLDPDAGGSRPGYRVSKITSNATP